MTRMTRPHYRPVYGPTVPADYDEASWQEGYDDGYKSGERAASNVFPIVVEFDDYEDFDLGLEFKLDALEEHVDRTSYATGRKVGFGDGYANGLASTFAAHWADEIDGEEADLAATKTPGHGPSANEVPSASI